MRIITLNAGLLLTLLPTTVTHAAEGKVCSERSVLVEVAAGKTDRHETPVAFVLPPALRDQNTFVLTRIDNGTSVPVQVIADDPPRVIWMLKDTLAAGKTRRYRLASQTAAANSDEHNAALHCEDDGDGLVIRAGEKQVLRYNHAVVPSSNPKTPYYARSGHLHPVFTPAGRQVTDDFAPDHPHQHGFMFAWTNTTYEDRAVNFWDQKAETGRVEHAKIDSTFSGPVFGGFSTLIRHSDLTAPGGARPVLSETWNVRACAIEGGFLCDLTSTQSVIGDSPLHINQYHYGGPAIRGNRQWLGADKSDFLTNEGKTRKNGNHSRPRWVDLHGKVDGADCGIAILTHPKNFRFPQPVRLHPSKPYFSLSPMVLGEFNIMPQQPYSTQLRFVAHDGRLSAKRAERLWNDFANPPTVRIVRDEETKP